MHLFDRIGEFGRAVVLAKRKRKPVVKAIFEGDSWFDYPIVGVSDLTDYLAFGLNDRGFGLKLAQYGHTAEEILSTEFKQMKFLLRRIKNTQPHVVFLSAGGNDVFEKLDSLLSNRAAAEGDIQKLLDSPKLAQRLTEVFNYYDQALRQIRQTSNQTTVVGHSYDVPRADGRGVDIDRIGALGPVADLLVDAGPWLKPPLARRGLTKLQQRTEFLSQLAQRFEQSVLTPLRDQHTHFHFVSLQGTLTQSKHDWNDELHPTDEGFDQLADRFLSQLQGFTTPDGLPWVAPD